MYFLKCLEAHIWGQHRLCLLQSLLAKDGEAFTPVWDGLLGLAITSFIFGRLWELFLWYGQGIDGILGMSVCNVNLKWDFISEGVQGQGMGLRTLQTFIATATTDTRLGC